MSSVAAAPVPVKSLESASFNPAENAAIQLLHAATMDPDDERAKRIRAECNKHIMTHALKHPECNLKTDISVWRMPDGRIVWTSPLVRAASKGHHKPLDRSAMPQTVIDALQNGDTYLGLALPSCAREELKKAVRKKPTPAAGATMPASDALLDSIARRVSVVNGDAHENGAAAAPADDLRNSIIVAAYQQYAGDMLTMRDGVARAGLFSVHDTSKRGDFVRALMGANPIDEERSPSDWVRVLSGHIADATEGEFTRQQALMLGASAVHDVTKRLANVATDMVAAAENRAALAAANVHSLTADVAMYRERNTALEAENAALTAQLAAAAAAPAADEAPKPAKPARKRAPSSGAPAAKRAAASAAAAPVLPAAELEAALAAELDAQPSDDMFGM
jgi:hypothetical protein